MIYNWDLSSQSKRWNFGFGDYGTNWNDANNSWNAVSANWDMLNNPWNAVNSTTQGLTNTASTHAQAFRNIGYATALLGGLGQYKAASQYENMASQYDGMAKNSQVNAALTRQQSLQTGQAGAKAANDTREKGARMIGAANAAYGASGIQSNTGSALDVKSGMAYRTERDAQTELRNTNIKMWALGNEAAQYDAQAKTYQNMASQQRELASQQRRSSLLNTALQVAKIYYGMG